MLRVLTLSTLFPDASRPTFGGFVARQTIGLAARDDVAVRVVAPIGVPPWPISRAQPYAALTKLSRDEVWQGLTVHRPRFPLLPGFGGPNARSLARVLGPLLRRIRADFAFDVIDAEFFYPDGPAAVRLGRELGVPVSIKARGADIHHWGSQRSTGRQIVDAAHGAAGMLAVSAALKADMVALGMPGERIRIHHTGVDLDRFTPADRDAAKAKLGLVGPVILTLGALIERKGHAHVLDALGHLPGVSWLVVGDGPLRPALESAAAPLGERVRFLGSREHDDLPMLIAAADAMVLPSASEGLANAWVEALACGVPIVATDVGGAGEVLQNDSAGRIVARDGAAIAQAVRVLLATPPDPAIVRRAAERFTWQANSDALFDHLASLVLATRPAPLRSC